jgi:hypothetical protein
VEDETVAGVVWAVVVLVFVAAIVASAFSKRRDYRGGSGPGAAAAGAVYDLLNQDKRNAIEIIVEDRAAARDPEDADGNLPDLQNPRRRR